MSSDQDFLSSRSAVARYDFARSARRVWRIVWRGKFLVFACVLLMLVPTYLFLRQMPRTYTAETTLIIQAPETNDVLTDRTAQMSPFRLNDDVMQTEVELLSSTMLARRVVDKLHLENDPEFNFALRPPSKFQQLKARIWPFGSETTAEDKEPATEGPEAASGPNLSPMAQAEMQKARIVRIFSSHLQVLAKRRTYVINVAFSSEDREKAALIANTVAELYVLDRLEASFNEARQVSTWLGERMGSLQKDALAAESAVEQFRTQNNLRRTSGNQLTINDQQLSELNSRLVIARADLAQKQARLQQVRSLGGGRGLDTSSDVLQAPLIQRLREQEAQKQRELSEAAKTYGDRHPHIVGLRADLDSLRSNIGSEIRKISASVENDVAVAQAGVATLESQLHQLQDRTNVAGETTVRLRDLERQAEASRSLYETFLVRFKREGEQANMRRANARVVSLATIPTVPSAPKVGKIMSLMTFLSLVLGVALVFVLEKLDHTVRSADDAEDVTGLPVLALVPRQGRKGHGDETALDEVRRDRRSALSDAIRSLRTALLTGEKSKKPYRTILVTSSVPREGKTFVSMYLAATFARLDQKVLLIDSDVFRPRLHEAMGVSGERGLVQVLNGEVEAKDAIQPNVLGTMDFLPAGQGAQVSDLLQSERLEALLAELLTVYPRIIIDSPPVLAVSDVRTVARLADAVIYLMKWGQTPRDGIRNGIKLLRSAEAHLAGVVLSQVDQQKHASYGYGDYGQYYGRYAEYYGKKK